MIEIKHGESGVYDFGLEISGDANGQPTLRMVIAHPNGYLLSFPASKFEGGGGYRVCLPCLDCMLPSGQHPYVLEVVLGDRIFYPLSDTLNIVEPPRVNATVSSVNSATAPTITAYAPQPTVQPQNVTIAQYESKSVEPAQLEKKKPAQADLDLMTALLKRK